MKNRRLLVATIVTVVLMGILVACNKDAQSKINFVFRPKIGDGTAAIISGDKINEKDLYAGIEAEIYQKRNGNLSIKNE